MYLPSHPVNQLNYCFLIHLEVKHLNNNTILTFNPSQFYTLNLSNWLRNVLKVLGLAVLLSRDQGKFGGSHFPCFTFLRFQLDLPILMVKLNLSLSTTNHRDKTSSSTYESGHLPLRSNLINTEGRLQVSSVYCIPHCEHIPRIFLTCKFK